MNTMFYAGELWYGTATGRLLPWSFIHIKSEVYFHIIQICSRITSGRVLDGELLYTKILEVNLFAFAYRLFHEDFSPIDGVMQPLVNWREIFMKQSVGI